MKTASIADSGLSWRCCRRRSSISLAVLAAGLTLFSAASLSVVKAATVDTLGGGPSVANPTSASGFADGNTFTDSQFNLPTGVALDPAGQFLFVADTANGAIRKLDLAGNLTTSPIPGLSTPVDVAVDAATNLYVLTQGDGLVRKYDSFGNFLGVLNATALVASPPTALALNASTNILVTLTDGSVVRINHPTNTTTTALVAAGTFSSPRGIEVMDNGTIVVSDTGNNAIRAINPTTLAVTLLAPTAVALPAPAGTANGSSTFARFNGPRHITKAGNNVLIVADTGNHRVRQIDVNGTVTLLYGVDPSLWNDASPDYPGWLDGNAGPNASDAQAREPEGLVVDGSGNLYVTERGYHIIRKVTGTGLTGPSGTFGGTGGTGSVPNPPSLTISPQSGYFPMGTTVTVTSTSDSVFFTTDGTTPTTNSTPVAMTGGIGAIRWFNSTNDLSALRVAAFLTSGTNTVSTNVAGAASTTNLVGIPSNVFAGVGATVYLPVVIDLRTNDQVKSIGFRVEIAPVAPLVTPVTSANVISTSTNDFVGLAGVSSDGSAVTLLTTSYTIGTTLGVAVSSLSPTNYLAKNFGVTAVLEVKIPGGLAIGSTYAVKLLYVSGTSDGGQTVVPLAAGPDRTITITNISYLVGDTSPGRWYNSGDFGNTETNNLDNADVNNVFLASLGLKVPYASSDAFNAMDTFPEIPPNIQMGDGFITFLDWVTVLNRSLRLDTNNFRRGWSTGTLTNAGPSALASRVAKSVATPPGAVWYRHASIVAPSVGNATPGSYVTIPVNVSAAAGIGLKGVQFRAAVTPIGSAPSLTERPQVIASSFGPALAVPQSLLPVGEVGVAYLVNFPAGSSQLGSIRFRIPANAVAGDAYAVRFSYLGGSLGGAEATVESVTARVVVLDAAPSAPVSLPDQWQANFFGSLTSPDADPNADPDGDGVVNWKEYLAGTNPTRADSRLRLQSAGLQANGGQSQAAIQLLTAPGKLYVLESTDNLGGGNWTTVETFSGDGYVREFIQTNALDQSRFYRVRVLQ